MHDPTDRAGRPRVIWNVNAGSKAGLPTNRIDEPGLRALLARHGLDDDIVATATGDECRAATRSALDAGCRPIVAAGGDGTTALVATELLGTDVPLGLLPLGSAMNLARSLAIPRDHDAAAAILAEGHERVIDVGLVAGGEATAHPTAAAGAAGERPFFECVSVGLSAELFAAAHEFDKGRYSSLLNLIEILRREHRHDIRLRLDGNLVRDRAIMIAIANTPFTGLGFTIAPDARLDDGLLDVRIFRRFTTFEVVRHFWSIAFGRRAHGPRIEQRRAREVVVETIGLPSRADDYDLGPTPIVARSRPRALRVIAPPVPDRG